MTGRWSLTGLKCSPHSKSSVPQTPLQHHSTPLTNLSWSLSKLPMGQIDCAIHARTPHGHWNRHVVGINPSSKQACMLRIRIFMMFANIIGCMFTSFVLPCHYYILLIRRTESISDETTFFNTFALAWQARAKNKNDSRTKLTAKEDGNHGVKVTYLTYGPSTRVYCIK